MENAKSKQGCAGMLLITLKNPDFNFFCFRLLHTRPLPSLLISHLFELFTAREFGWDYFFVNFCVFAVDMYLQVHVHIFIIIHTIFELIVNRI